MNKCVPLFLGTFLLPKYSPYSAQLYLICLITKVPRDFPHTHFFYCCYSCLKWSPHYRFPIATKSPVISAMATIWKAGISIPAKNFSGSIPSLTGSSDVASCRSALWPEKGQHPSTSRIFLLAQASCMVAE